ncbi:MAG TPA: zinc ribbon domain-containing protein [Gaiellaceae bacterium]|nr:zinc ribbon domain-containing protein [Gaiellaceae bacterium]
METTCPNCGAEVDDSTLDRCPDCSVPIKVTCPNCGEKAAADEDDCPACGAPLAHAAEAG